MREKILNHLSEKKPAPRFCDVIIDADRIYLEAKHGKWKETVDWDDLQSQVEEAKQLNKEL